MDWINVADRVVFMLCEEFHVQSFDEKVVSIKKNRRGIFENFNSAILCGVLIIVLFFI